jgi:hypothetical protein
MLNEMARVDAPLRYPRAVLSEINRRFAIDHAAHWPKNPPQHNVAPGEPRRSGREERKDSFMGLRRNSAPEKCGTARGGPRLPRVA